MPQDEIDAEKPKFKSKLGLVLACLGSVVGTGNIWRYPRIVANNSGNQGGLVFLLLWGLGLWVWSIPIKLVEFAIGRYTRKNVIASFKELIGPWAQWMGAWIVLITLFIGAYYSVVLGWCFYYLIHSMAYPLPQSYAESTERWEELNDTYYPLLCHAIATLLAGVCIVRGVRTVELANKILVPLLLLIVAFSLAWSLSLPYAYEGITYLFSPDWDVLKTSQVWVDAITQNAWDTGTAGGTMVAYATYMSRKDGVVSIGTLTPLANNLVSLCCGIMIFCNVFSVLTLENRSREYIVRILKDNGPANTGLTFIWVPLLYKDITFGRGLAVLFFLSLSFAGFSSLIGIFELQAVTLENMGLRRIPAAITVTIGVFLLGLPSALKLSILVNQDSAWSFGLIPSGLIFCFLVAYYGIERFRNGLVNDFGLDDWKLRKIWKVFIGFISPLIGVALIIWWIVNNINDDSRWYYLEDTSLMLTIFQWIILLIILLNANLLYQKCIAKRPLDLDTIQDGSVEVGGHSGNNEEYLATRKLLQPANSKGSKQGENKTVTEETSGL
eukprot:m.13866 g.13866  ORF g.13866 m.13866 type:complete len:554 (+) comp25278_c0_seq1:1702-3363(+)